MRITIVGGGNIGTQFAVHCAEKGHEVTVFTSTPELFSKHLMIVDDKGNITHEGDIKIATGDPEAAFSEAEMILIAMPPTMLKRISTLIESHASAKAMIGVVPGNGGWECAFKERIESGQVFFGIERVPAIARLVQKGKCVKSTGYRDELHIATLPAGNAARCCGILSGIFDMPCKSIPGYLNLTMTPSNPILHTTRLRSIFGEWHEGQPLKKIPLFYEEWDNSSSELLFACDEEVQAICRALPEFHLEYVRSLKDHYESHTIESMTHKISSIPAFKGLTTPAIVVEGGYIPDLYSRYFTADFSFGLSVIQQTARFAGVDTPNIDATMDWYRRLALVREEFRFGDYGIMDSRSFREFYLR